MLICCDTGTQSANVQKLCVIINKCSFEPFTCLDLVLEHLQSFLFQIKSKTKLTFQSTHLNESVQLTCLWRRPACCVGWQHPPRTPPGCTLGPHCHAPAHRCCIWSDKCCIQSHSHAPTQTLHMIRQMLHIITLTCTSTQTLHMIRHLLHTVIDIH